LNQENNQFKNLLQ